MIKTWMPWFVKSVGQWFPASRGLFSLLFGAFTGREDSGKDAMRSEKEKQAQGLVKWP